MTKEVSTYVPSRDDTEQQWCLYDSKDTEDDIDQELFKALAEPAQEVDSKN